MMPCTYRVKCGVVESMKKKQTFRWFGHIQRMKNEEFMKEIYVSEIDEPRRRTVVRWMKRVKKYMHEGDTEEWEDLNK